MKKVILLSALSALYSCNSNKPQQAPGVAEFPVVKVAQRNVTGYTEFPVTIKGINNNDVRAKIQGYIKKVFVDEGQLVNVGTPLFQLETNILTQNADAAKSALTAAEANIEASQAAVKAAEVEVQKLEPLVAKNIIGAAQLETAKANLARAQAALAQAVASKGQANSTLKGIQENINFSIVKSPIRGVVGSIPFREGSLVGPSDMTPLTTVSETSSVYAYFSMNEKEYLDFLGRTPGTTVKEKLKNIPEVDLVLANGELYPEKGKVQAVTGQIDASTGSIQFRVTFRNPAGLLSNGNSGKIRIPKTYENALVFPEMSLFERQGSYYVYSVKQDTAYMTRVQVVDRTQNLVIAGEGIKEGDLIVTQGTSNLRDKTPVKPVKQDINELLSTIKPVF
ncbi:efflux transporter, RND family, MFP subunit [Leadbetterella byssophila DSM 17132]|uniref:Efflux transporter, RND family, MFP subunit n=1 Tax=Leadbetterella byssophila (strain DSM 17132 / JCM 16389 / KACC 11308 / NBRC 106382 / 4M15) TaxID=649349 RepID=E4RR10_LEAB4|nr:efflux RND transporter periplasmic adaptor subunit [Leadbetterella byssophila]ADQ16605.1 efflux transporter, RND family, MFP subunit [Leadbetterella byssophila DSM 17132]